MSYCVLLLLLRLMENPMGLAPHVPLTNFSLHPLFLTTISKEKHPSLQ